MTNKIVEHIYTEGCTTIQRQCVQPCLQIADQVLLGVPNLFHPIDAFDVSDPWLVVTKMKHPDIYCTSYGFVFH
jgi:hypothetical protein